MASWDETVDFLVVGSGGGGLTAAIRAHDLGASALVIEKAPVYGGSTAWSGGVIWVPNNLHMDALGIADSPEEGLQYLERITAGSSTPERLRAYVETAPRMMQYLAEHSWLRFQPIEDYPDYYPELPGGKLGGRSCEPCELDALKLGEEFRRQNLHDFEYYFFGFMTSMAHEGKPMMSNSPAGIWILMRETLRYAFNLRARLRGRRNTRLTLGGALVGRGRRSLMDRKLPLWLSTGLRELVLEEGRLVGAVAEREGVRLRIRARRGVLLAAGGFEHNAALRQKYQQDPIGSDWTAGARSNTGDTLAIGEKIGASFDLLEDAWWCPSFKIPGKNFIRLVIFEKNLPGGIIVNQRGERFMNEAAPYNDVVKAIYAANARAPSIPAYLIFDRSFRKKYPVGPVFPSRIQPDWAIPKRTRDWLKKEPTLAGLAREVGIDGERLQRTVQRFNEFARAGKDLDFGRGDSAQDHYYSVLARGPNPNLAPLEKGPYYAVEVWPGDLGTKGGLRTDARARVLDQASAPIPGLFATGNCSAAVMGHSYPGAGGTIGPSMTFGFIAAEEAMGFDPAPS
jgi:3-oxosteroid 1-dehydrogenase